ncbi:hypothetical protein LTR56_009518 [Elasticomyces elasticus]|nr:hypothetical protein LTR56_009518 [Elasticomyces elasticus]KAK3657197.1 hypothetical protein LTR22_009371 [Elasticomyces elasticus]KAK4922256.1 hypothetical protein LTR49_010477 [Elasticomyces elasticus]KAK5760805.1 hypothetical protein LTS12_008981 [Elasticomyces elasticus]
MATDILSQWNQVRTIMDSYQARIQRLDTETEAMHIELESIEQRGATILQAIDAAAKQRIKLVETMETTARDISQGVLDSTVPAQTEISPPATPHAMEMPPAQVIAKASQTLSDDHDGLLQAIPPVGGLNLPATPASTEPETPTTYDNGDDGEHDHDDDHKSVDAAFAAMDARTAKAEASLKRKRPSSPLNTAEVSMIEPLVKKTNYIPDNIDGTACIDMRFPTIVPQMRGRGWVELRCHICWGNLKVQGGFLRGRAAFRTHYRTRHLDRFQSIEQITLKYVLEHASYQELTPEQAQRIQAGERNVYEVPKLVGDVTRCTKQSKAKAGVAKGGSNEIR